MITNAAVSAKNPITPTIPLDQDGVHHGFLRLPYSRDDSAWGSVMIPMTVIKKGNGPTALLTGANHGDEYEGPVALQELAVTLSPDDVSGRVIIVPFFNYPAFRAERRTSPIDGVNLNRAFPGRPDGSVTQKIADYFNAVLVPQSDYVLDFHSGGKTLDFLPFAAAHILESAEQQAACIEAMKAFNAPYSMIMLEIDNVGMYDTAVESQGKVFVTTELGGGGSASAKTISVARKGIRNFLIHAGITKGEPVVEDSVNLDMPDEDCFHFCEYDGLLEPMVDLGDMVEEGNVIARIWSMERTGLPPIGIHARRSGLMTARHFPGLVKTGDCVAVIAEILAED